MHVVNGGHAFLKGACMLRGVCAWQGGHAWQAMGWGGGMHAGEIATEAGSPHPTRMHSCWHLILNIHPFYCAEDPSKYREPQEASYIRYGRKQTGAVATRNRIPSRTYETGRTIQPAYKSTASYWVSYNSPHMDPHCHRNATGNKIIIKQPKP